MKQEMEKWGQGLNGVRYRRRRRKETQRTQRLFVNASSNHNTYVYVCVCVCVQLKESYVTKADNALHKNCRLTKFSQYQALEICFRVVGQDSPSDLETTENRAVANARFSDVEGETLLLKTLQSQDTELRKFELDLT